MRHSRTDGHGLRLPVLIVEDEQQVREELFEMLELRGLTVQATDGVSTTLAALDGVTGPIVLLTDLRLPDGSGLDIIQHIQNDPRLASAVTRIIVMTGHTDITEQLAGTLQRQGISLVFKPVDIAPLMSLLTGLPGDD